MSKPPEPESAGWVGCGLSTCTKNHGSNFFIPLCDLDEEELTNMVDNIIKESFWLSTPVVKNVCAETLYRYCKCIKDERLAKNIICEYFKVHDVHHFHGKGLVFNNVIKFNNMAPNDF